MYMYISIYACMSIMTCMYMYMYDVIESVVILKVSLYICVC